ASVRRLLQLGVALVSGERIASGRDEAEDLLEAFARQALIERGARHFTKELVRIEGLRARCTEHVLSEHIERTRPRRWRVPRALLRGLERRLALHHLEAAGTSGAFDGSSIR